MDLVKAGLHKHKNIVMEDGLIQCVRLYLGSVHVHIYVYLIYVYRVNVFIPKHNDYLFLLYCPPFNYKVNCLK